jgi:hypothetical protein
LEPEHYSHGGSQTSNHEGKIQTGSSELTDTEGGTDEDDSEFLLHNHCVEANYAHQRNWTYSEDGFYLGQIKKPSAQYSTWTYRWRGERFSNYYTEYQQEITDGIIKGSDEKSYTITFKGKGGIRNKENGHSLIGSFGGGLSIPYCTFSGEKDPSPKMLTN